MGFMFALIFGFGALAAPPDSHRMGDLTKYMINTLDDIGLLRPLLFRLQRHSAQGSQIPWASACSGIDAFAKWIPALEAQMKQTDPGHELEEKQVRPGSLFRQAFACENNPTKLNFMRRQGFAEHTTIFKNIFHLCKTGGSSCFPDDSIAVCPWAAILIVGFVCSSVSRLNINRSSFRKSVRDAVGATGETFSATLQWIDNFGPWCFILENVLGLFDDAPGAGDKNSNAQEAAALLALAASGYIVRVIILNAFYYYLPHRRIRVFFVGLPLGLSNATDLLDAIERSVLAMASGERVPLHQIMDAHRACDRATKKRKYSMRMETETRKKWVGEHKAAFEKIGLPFEIPHLPEEVQSYHRTFEVADDDHDFAQLTLRQQSLVHYLERKPWSERQKREMMAASVVIADIGLSLGWANEVSCDICPCISTRFAGWDLNSRQKMHPFTLFDLQGMDANSWIGIEDLTETAILEMTGEAFCMPCVSAVLLAILVHLDIPHSEADARAMLEIAKPQEPDAIETELNIAALQHLADM